MLLKDKIIFATGVLTIGIMASYFEIKSYNETQLMAPWHNCLEIARKNNPGITNSNALSRCEIFLPTDQR